MNNEEYIFYKKAISNFLIENYYGKLSFISLDVDYEVDHHADMFLIQMIDIEMMRKVYTNIGILRDIEERSKEETKELLLGKLNWQLKEWFSKCDSGGKG